MAWNWEQITAVATVLGVLGGLISVGFVVYEVRRNADAIEGATVQGLMSLEVQVFSILAEHSSVYERGAADLASLTSGEHFLFNRLVGCKLSLLNSAFVQYEQQLIDEDVWSAYVRAFQEDTESPGFLTTWRAIEDRYPEDFRENLKAHTRPPERPAVA
ncbi:hypothetical protein OEZ60_04795 [Defluviimonas sp. WL0024]|uniref:DUF4760 domain-containing protein n=1 Tax=Albidovulum salinarum TaxID=2984153 RepID=A0ABT2X054_9RHOB|nr:hypothetical protein [Defluviimonas sp. WL0024]MCU9847316.1 hypothetical protein [Defluviimonas sp. WL0024]